MSNWVRTENVEDGVEEEILYINNQPDHYIRVVKEKYCGCAIYYYDCGILVLERFIEGLPMTDAKVKAYELIMHKINYEIAYWQERHKLVLDEFYNGDLNWRLF